jgi:Uma2 family endonuclease
MTVRRRPTTRGTPNGAPPEHVLTKLDYPEGDGKPMAETPIHRDVMLALIAMLQAFFAHRPDVYVSGNMMLYYEQGNRRAVTSPDVLVTVGIPKLPERRVYFLWREVLPPTFVIELTSRSTRRHDLIVKRDLYARLGIAEHFLFDPLGEYLHPPLRGFRLTNGVYEAIAADPDGTLDSDSLGLRLAIVRGQLRLFDRTTGLMIPTADERALAAQQQALSERLHADAAERQLRAERARFAELEKRLEELERRQRDG